MDKQETLIWYIGQKHRLEKENATLRRENEALLNYKEEVGAVADTMYQYTMKRLVDTQGEQDE